MQTKLIRHTYVFSFSPSNKIFKQFEENPFQRVAVISIHDNADLKDFELLKNLNRFN